MVLAKGFPCERHRTTTETLGRLSVSSYFPCRVGAQETQQPRHYCTVMDLSLLSFVASGESVGEKPEE